jgi:hypothetical protein
MVSRREIKAFLGGWVFEMSRVWRTLKHEERHALSSTQFLALALLELEMRKREKDEIAANSEKMK